MRRVVLVSVPVLVLAMAACRQYLPSGRYLQVRKAELIPSTADARGKFGHARHQRVLAAHNATCIACHRFDLVIAPGDEAAAHELSAHAQYPGGAACHFCHGPSPTQIATAPSACTTCHDNLGALRPEDHDVAWMKVHASVASAQPAQCESCHRSSFCVDCHSRRDTLQTVVHDRNFRFFHSIEARANPMRCGSCHRLDFCSNCHQQGKVELPP